MAKTKKIKNYTIKVADGRFVFQMNKESADGRTHAMVLPYPHFEMRYNEVKEKNELVKMTRKETEDYCVKHAKEHKWFDFATDGNK